MRASERCELAVTYLKDKAKDGLYRYIVDGVIVYIGKSASPSNNIRQRIKDHSKEKKFQPVLSICKIEYISLTGTSYEKISEYEEMLIKYYCPILNDVHNHGIPENTSLDFPFGDNWEDWEEYESQLMIAKRNLETAKRFDRDIYIKVKPFSDVIDEKPCLVISGSKPIKVTATVKKRIEEAKEKVKENRKSIEMLDLLQHEYSIGDFTCDSSGMLFDYKENIEYLQGVNFTDIKGGFHGINPPLCLQCDKDGTHRKVQISDWDYFEVLAGEMRQLAEKHRLYWENILGKSDIAS